MSLRKSPPKWYEVYPQGTPEGDQEQKFFTSLARSQWDWRTTAALARETGLPVTDIEAIIEKYRPLGLVIQHPDHADQWGYWERVGTDALVQQACRSSVDQP